jgi:hypothetical protein
VPEWGVFCHTARLRNRPARLKLVLSYNTIRRILRRSITDKKAALAY